MAGIFLQFHPEHRIADRFQKRKLAVGDMHAADVLQIDRRLRGIHLFPAHGDVEFHIRQSDLRNAEFASASRALGRGKDRPRAGSRIVLLGRVPIREDGRIRKIKRTFTEARRRIIVFHAVQGAYLIGIQKTARDLTLQLDIASAGRDHELGTAGLSSHRLNGGRSHAVSRRRIGEKDLTAALGSRKIDRRLNRRGIVGNAVTLRAKIKNVNSKIHNRSLLL